MTASRSVLRVSGLVLPTGALVPGACSADAAGSGADLAGVTVYRPARPQAARQGSRTPARHSRDGRGW